MNTEEKIHFIVETINLSDSLSVYEYNFNEDVRRAYLLMHDEESLRNALEREKLLDVNRFFQIHYALKSFIEKNAVDLEFANSYVNKINNFYTRNWIKIDLVKYAITAGNFMVAERIIDEIPDEDSGPGRYLAHRHILEYHASVGDIANFKNRVKAAKLGRFPRYGVEAYKHLLIEGIAKKFGIDRAFEIIEDKYFEKTAAFRILRWNAHHLSIEEIDRLLDAHPRIIRDTPEAKADLYVLHCSGQGDVLISDEEFEKVLNVVLHTDKDAKCGDMRCRDILLFDLGAATLSKRQAIECKKHLVTPVTKRELNYAIKHKEEANKYIS